jgi:hypothetical protein
MIRACSILLALSALAFAPAAAFAQSPASYVLVKPDDAKTLLGADLAARALSDEFTELRKERLSGSLGGIPGLDCSKGSRFGLMQFIRFADIEDRKIWMERYAVECNKATTRSLLVVLRDGKLEDISLMVVGETITDPQLQMSALAELTPLALALAARDCKEHYVYDTVVIERPKDGSSSWKERWSFVACGKTVDVEAAFVPTGNGTTSIIGQVRK